MIRSPSPETHTPFVCLIYFIYPLHTDLSFLWQGANTLCRISIAEPVYTDSDTLSSLSVRGPRWILWRLIKRRFVTFCDARDNTHMGVRCSRKIINYGTVKYQTKVCLLSSKRVSRSDWFFRPTRGLFCEWNSHMPCFFIHLLLHQTAAVSVVTSL